ncbi:DapH/DapD/GlmU-related protein [Pedobacter xixiisoli]|uniref:Lipopolysaccharide O-acetyltransferase n=1 Tax=Pedobacter xixiisoli TaxID=1476464 RepID=A0A286AEL8_9SPHI|nr:DapH/DapD/GlmU-related protein [Pedobacter xixiisoli]SOD20342.1 lipopolysaccharide O-acetyltransferase [Pedobacter xixiisoli]
MVRTYGLLGSIKMLRNIIMTKLLYSKSRLVRFPIDIRNEKNISWGIGLTTGVGNRIECYPQNGNLKTLFLGDNIQINDYNHITAMENVTIGNNVLLASKIYISDCSHGSYSGDENDSDPTSIPNNRPLYAKPVTIEDNVWLGEFVSVLPGVTIGKGTIVGANSVVSKSLPPNVIAVGSPAKPIKKYNFESQRWEKI